MTRSRWIVLAATMVVVITGTLVLAQGPARRGGGPGGGPGVARDGFGGGRGFGFGVRDLDLSDAQREQVRAIVAKAREDNRPLADRYRQAAEARRTAMAQTPVDENQIRATTQALASAEADLAVARARVQSDIFALLTPEQQTKVTEARERRQARAEERRNRQQRRQQDRQNQ